MICVHKALIFNIPGGWIYGQAYDREYNPVGLVQESVAGGHPVIYVAINYRVGSMPLHQCVTDVRC